MLAHAAQVVGDTVIALDPKNTAQLFGVTAATLDSDDIILV